MSIYTNIASLRAQSRLSTTSRTLESIFERLASGRRINRASDDAAGLAIASSLNADARVYTQSIRNINDGLSALNIASGTLGELTGVLQRLKELATQSSNGVFGRTQRLSIDKEAHALTNEFNRLVSSTKFNGLNLLNGGLGRMSIQLGYGTDGQIGFNLGSDLSQNVGLGTFNTATTISAGTNTRDVEMADLNGDGKLDLIYSAFSSNPGLFVSLSNGDGTFQTAVSYDTGGSGAGIAVADFDGDGDNDVALASGAGNSRLNVFLNNGNGTLATRVSYVSALNPNSVAAGDLNGDGAIDLITRGNGSYLEVFLNNGNGSYSAALTYATQSTGTSLALADFNGDGRLDVATDSGTNTNILLGNGNGSFGQYSVLSQVSVGTSPSGYAVGDINHDGIVDLISAGGGTQTPYIYLGRGDGTFNTATSLGVSLGVFNYSVKLADLNGDGNLDLVAGESIGNKLSIFVGNGDGTFRLSSTVAASSAYDLAVGDLNGDGVPDIVSSSPTPANRLEIFFQNSTIATTIGRLDLTTQQASLNALSLIDSIMQRVSKEISTIGSAQSRLLAGLNNNITTRDNSLEAANRILSTDVASESANLVKHQILQRVGAAVLAQANLEPNLALRLLQQ